MKDPELSPMCLCGVEAFWKLLILLLFGPFYRMIAVPKEVSLSGKLEDFGQAIADLESNQTLMNLVIVNALLVGLAHAFGYAIIKYEDAVMQTTITLSIIMTTWLFFLLWPYQGHEKFNVFTLLGMVLLGLGSFMYVKAERSTTAEPEARTKRSNNESEALNSESEVLLNEQDL